MYKNQGQLLMPEASGVGAMSAGFGAGGLTSSVLTQQLLAIFNTDLLSLTIGDDWIFNNLEKSISYPASVGPGPLLNSAGTPYSKVIVGNRVGVIGSVPASIGISLPNSSNAIYIVVGSSPIQPFTNYSTLVLSFDSAVNFLIADTFGDNWFSSIPYQDGVLSPSLAVNGLHIWESVSIAPNLGVSYGGDPVNGRSWSSNFMLGMCVANVTPLQRIAYNTAIADYYS